MSGNKIRERMVQLLAQRLHPHEIDGDIFPPDVQEYDATETLQNPLETLENKNVPGNVDPTMHLLGKIITMAEQMVGRNVLVPAGTDLNRPVEIISLRCPDDLNSIFSVTMGVQGVGQPGMPTPPGGEFVRVGAGGSVSPTHAVIQWGAGAVQFESIVDINQGRVLTVGGSFLRVLATNNLISAAGVPVDATFSVFVSLLPKGSQKRPASYTNDSGPIAGAGVFTQSIPPFARTVKIFRAPATAPFTLQFLSVTGIVIHEVAIPAGGDCPEEPIPQTASGIGILNGAIAITHAAVYFEMDL